MASITFRIWQRAGLVIAWLAHLAVPAQALAQTATQSEPARPAVATARDPMLPSTGPEAAFASSLQVITIVTGDLEQTRRFYQGALSMVGTSFEMSGQPARALRRHWNMADGAQLKGITFAQPGALGSIRVRAIQADVGAPSSRPVYDPEFPGALGLGLPMRGLARREAIVSAYGFRSAVGVTTMAFPRADRTTYDVGEIHFRAPDDILVLGVDRADLTPVGPIDEALDVGGPAYSSAIISTAEAFLPILKDVLGLELRREMTFLSGGPSGGMGLPDKTKVLFEQWFSPGTTTGYLVIMDLIDAGKPNPVPLGLRARGVAMWTFYVPSLRDVMARARRAGVKIQGQPERLMGPDGTSQNSVVLLTPDGFPVDVIEMRPSH